MSKSFIRCAIASLSLTFVAACTPSGSDTPSDKPADDSGAGEGGEPKPESNAATKIAVASVQMIQDCPDTEVEAPPARPPADEPAAGSVEPPAPGAMAQPMTQRKAKGDYDFVQPCDQSAVQLAIETASESPVAIEIKAVRLMSEGKPVGTLATRKPKIWANNSYETWDQQIAPGAPIKVSYKLSMPSWSEVEQKIGTSSFGHMFTLEIDVLVDGKVQTVSSLQFPREEPHVIVT